MVNWQQKEIKLTFQGRFFECFPVVCAVNPFLSKIWWKSWWGWWEYLVWGWLTAFFTMDTPRYPWWAGFWVPWKSLWTALYIADQCVCQWHRRTWTAHLFMVWPNCRLPQLWYSVEPSANSVSPHSSEFLAFTHGSSQITMITIVAECHGLSTIRTSEQIWNSLNLRHCIYSPMTLARIPSTKVGSACFLVLHVQKSTSRHKKASLSILANRNPEKNVEVRLYRSF